MIMSNIKIFVSHRIDIDSELINNPLYIPVRCGAVFDQENPIGILGDDTGDNISEKRMSFCEFTVQYWAWKNVKADYYGLCHYRRYLSFSPKHFRTDSYNMIHKAVLTPGCKRKYGLLNWQEMEQEICGYDMLVSERVDVRSILTPHGRCETVLEHWTAQDGIYLKKSSIELMFQLIDELAPQYSQSAKEYFSGPWHRGFNCYIMKKELFEQLCAFQFPILFEIERRLDTSGYTQTMRRTPAFIGEMLYGIFVYHMETYKKLHIKELQLLFFRDTSRIQGQFDLIKKAFWNNMDRLLRAIIDPIIPKGSYRREAIKNIYYFVTPAKRHGIADIKEK